MNLEEDLQRQLHRSRITRELRCRMVEVGTLRPQNVDLRAGKTNGRDVVQKSRNVLRVVEEIERLCLEFDLEPFRDGESLQGGDIDVVDGIQLQRVAARGGKSTKPSLNVLRVRIFRSVRDDVRRGGCAGRTGRQTAVAQRVHAAASSRRALCVEDR